MSLLIYGGSLEFVAVEMLLSPFAPIQVFIMALLIQARHLFYGLSMLDKYKGILGRFCNFRWHHRFFTPHSYRRHQLCHDCYVRRYLHGSVAERKESYIFITWTWNFFSLSPCIRTGLFYDSDHDFDYRLIDIITQKA